MSKVGRQKVNIDFGECPILTHLSSIVGQFQNPGSWRHKCIYLTWVQLFKTNDVVNYMLRIVKTLIIKYGKYTISFAEKMWVNAKTTHIFFNKNTCELDIVLNRTVNILTTNELVKLTMLWTTGPKAIVQKMSRKNHNYKP